MVQALLNKPLRKVSLRNNIGCMAVGPPRALELPDPWPKSTGSACLAISVLILLCCYYQLYTQTFGNILLKLYYSKLTGRKRLSVYHSSNSFGPFIAEWEFWPLCLDPMTPEPNFF